MIEPVPMLSDQDQVQVRVRCTDCAGTGIRREGHRAAKVVCRECGRDYSERATVELAPREKPWPTLPCGHDWEALSLPEPCLCCAGQRYITQHVNLGAIRRWLATPAEPRIVPVTAPKPLGKRAAPRKRPVKVSA